MLILLYLFIIIYLTKYYHQVCIFNHVSHILSYILLVTDHCSPTIIYMPAKLYFQLHSQTKMDLSLLHSQHSPQTYNGRVFTGMMMSNSKQFTCFLGHYYGRAHLKYQHSVLEYQSGANSAKMTVSGGHISSASQDNNHYPMKCMFIILSFACVCTIQSTHLSSNDSLVTPCYPCFVFHM